MDITWLGGLKNFFYLLFTVLKCDHTPAIFGYLIFFSDWRQLIHVAAIDCAEERNLATCVHYQIQGYPSVKVSVINSAGSFTLYVLLPFHISPLKVPTIFFHDQN